MNHNESRTPDTWNGKQLPTRGTVNTEIHYRLYDAVTGAVLSFGSTNVLDTVVQDALSLHASNPGVQLLTAQMDGPAWT